ncbi:MAG: OmpA family protein [Ignavibacteria bacterium]|nr:MAG: OmpA family protein [Ignavibacteria bacterium]
MNKGDELSFLEETIEEANKYFRKSIEYSIRAEKEFKTTLKARNDCMAVGADTLSYEIWNDAESTFRDAMDEFEDDSPEDAIEYAFEAEKIYRSAELDAIKKIVCGPTWELLEKAADQNVKAYAPITLKDAKDLIYSAEKDLEEKRYDNSYAKKLADSAYSEALHAINITEYLKMVDEKDITQEEIIIFYEEPLKAIAQRLNVNPKFEDGYITLLANISKRIEELKENGKIGSELKKELASKQNELDKVKLELNQTKQELNEYNELKEKIISVKRLFLPSEAETFTLNDDLVIRIKKLSFATGSSVISPRYFGLLTKVINAIEKFPGSKVIVAAYTDGSGKADKNLIISQRRADAVYQYILANSDIGRKRLSSIGYGESKPIASDETAKGSRMNRRIEVIIKNIK